MSGELFFTNLAVSILLGVVIAALLIGIGIIVKTATELVWWIQEDREAGRSEYPDSRPLQVVGLVLAAIFCAALVLLINIAIMSLWSAR